jgi:hypothetical protein
MSGAVTDSSVGQYIGLRALLVVEDGGEGKKNGSGDRFAWGLYRSGSMTWIATDGELEFDPGAGMSWYASDFENEDDTPVPMGANSSPSPVNCDTFSIRGYDLQEVPHGAGNIHVKP